jgi:TRAP-type mannitol/chloroaromatic compound transport system substrate-binding protein
MRKQTLLLFAALLLILPMQAQAAKKIRWKLATTWSTTLKPLANSGPQLAKMVEEMTGGNFIIRVVGAEKHKAPLGVLDMVKGGQYEMAHTASYYWKGKDISTIFFATFPFGMLADELAAWNWYGGGNELAEEVYKKFGVYHFPGGNSGVQMGGWFKKEIKTLDDLKGLKMRIPGLAGEVFARLGVNVTNIAPGELYTSLDRGTIDALEWVGPAMDLKMGFQKIAPYYYTGWHEPGPDLEFLVNRKAMDSLSPEYQAILKTAIRAVAADSLTENFTDNALAWDKIKTEYPGVHLKTFPEPVLKAMKKATDEVMDGYAAKDPEFKKIYESQKTFMKKMRAWSNVSTGEVLNTAELVGE